MLLEAFDIKISKHPIGDLHQRMNGPFGKLDSSVSLICILPCRMIFEFLRILVASFKGEFSGATKLAHPPTLGFLSINGRDVESHGRTRTRCRELCVLTYES